MLRPTKCGYTHTHSTTEIDFNGDRTHPHAALGRADQTVSRTNLIGSSSLSSAGDCPDLERKQSILELVPMQMTGL